ncbi:hypothetical protein PINS_up004982 [Pythium insidiosum]|nr:hypothetical protein PINS_up004982 [Pythium insidiosum]
MHPTRLSLRQSRKLGILVIDTASETVTFRYPQGKTTLFRRTITRPARCVVGHQVLKVFAGRDKQSAFVCRIATTQDVEACVEVMRVIGVDVVHVAPEVFLRPREEPAHNDDAETSEASGAFSDALKGMMDPVCGCENCSSKG